MVQKELPKTKIDKLFDLYSSGKIDEALTEASYLKKQYLNEPLLFSICGGCYISLGSPEKALEQFIEAAKIRPDISDFHYNLGAIYSDLEEFENAIDSYIKAIEINPQHIKANFNLGILLYKKNLFFDAADHFENVLLIEPENIDALINLANTLKDLGDLNTSINKFKKVLTIDSRNFIAHNNLGAIFREINDVHEAISHYEKALEIKPDYVEAMYNLGFIFQDIGQIDKSIFYYEQAINIGNHAMSFHSISHLKSFKEKDIYVSKLKSIYSSKNLKNSEKIHICLALANINEKFGNQVDFFKYLNEGNELQKKESEYSLNQHKKEHAAIKKIFSQDIKTIQNIDSSSKSKKIPIFILGMPRSGTSLVEQIISTHSEVYGAGELKFLSKLSSPIINNFIQGDIDNLSDEALEFVRNEYLDLLQDFNVNEKFITDKLPLNFQYIGFIISAFPEAKIVHLERDPRAVCWSNYRYYFGEKNNGYSNDFEDLAGFYGSYRDLMNFWNNLYPGKLYNLCYEKLTENQEAETRNLLKYCGLEWDENCLNFHENTNSVKTISSLQVKKKLYQGSSEEWKKHWAYIQPLINALENYSH
jgi:tetratricopeptide (TPR) repeat protein